MAMSSPYDMRCAHGLPHSGIPGSMDVCSSPRLLAAYHALLRQTAPSHPPWTLIYLTILFYISLPYITPAYSKLQMLSTCQRTQMEVRGLEPRTPGLQSRCSNQLSYTPGYTTEQADATRFAIGKRRKSHWSFATYCAGYTLKPATLNRNRGDSKTFHFERR